MTHVTRDVTRDKRDVTRDSEDDSASLQARVSVTSASLGVPRVIRELMTSHSARGVPCLAVFGAREGRGEGGYGTVMGANCEAGA